MCVGTTAQHVRFVRVNNMSTGTTYVPLPQYDTIAMTRHVTWAQGPVSSDDESASSDDSGRFANGGNMTREAHAESFAVQGGTGIMLLLIPAFAMVCGGVAAGLARQQMAAACTYDNALSTMLLVGAAVCALATLPQYLTVAISGLLHTSTVERTPYRYDRLAWTGALLFAYAFGGSVVLAASCIYNARVYGQPVLIANLVATPTPCATSDLVLQCLGPLVFVIAIGAAGATLMAWIVAEIWSTSRVE